MMLVGLTGGIGSGKTTAAKMFKELGVPVFIADQEAKYLMRNSKVIRRKLIALFGEKAYLDDDLNRPFLAQKIFNDKTLLQKMNAIVHPKVAKRFKRWVDKQNSPYVISEVAILFENGSYKNYDSIVIVTAPIKERIRRIIERDQSSEEKIKRIMDNQWSDADKIKQSDYVITNMKLSDTKKQVLKIHKILTHKSLTGKF